MKNQDFGRDTGIDMANVSQFIVAVLRQKIPVAIVFLQRSVFPNIDVLLYVHSEMIALSVDKRRSLLGVGKTKSDNGYYKQKCFSH